MVTRAGPASLLSSDRTGSGRAFKISVGGREVGGAEAEVAQQTIVEPIDPGMAKTARSEGHDEVADWFETLAKAERSHANRYAKALAELAD